MEKIEELEVKLTELNMKVKWLEEEDISVADNLASLANWLKNPGADA
jgi:hypothetical protein